MTTFKKTLCLLLVFSMVISLPNFLKSLNMEIKAENIVVSAEEKNSEQQNTEKDIVENNIIATPSTENESGKISATKTIIKEDESKRGKFEKHFICSDGSYVAIVYSEAVHYQKDGKWIDSNNAISLESKSGKYTSENTDFNVTFASSKDDKKLVTVVKDDYAVSWNLKANSVNSALKTNYALMINNETNIKTYPLTKSSYSGKLLTDKSAYDLPETTGKITYENAFSSEKVVDLKYTVSQDKIKEDIIIKSPTEYTSYTYEMDIGELSAKLNDDNSVSLCDKSGTAIYTINTPYMYDSSDEFSYDIDVSLVQKGTTCIVTYSPDKEWITSKDRIYPIVIDPTITTKDYSAGIIDTFVRQNRTTNYSNNIKLFVGTYQGNLNRSYIKVSSLPETIANTQLEYVSLNIRVPTGTTTGGTFALKRVNSAWDPSTITYANQPTVLSSNTASVTYTPGQIDYVFDVTNDFLNNVFSNGYCLRYSNESINDYNTFWSNEYGTIADRPYFVFQYNPAISLNRDQVELSVGGNITLEATAYNTGHPVIWSSSNSSIATVDSTGKVTAIRPGFATITSTLIISNGESIEDSCQVIVKLQNGVYYIQNRNSNYYLNVDGGKIVNGTDVQQYYQFSSASDSPTKLRQMWRTHYLGNGYYSIRPMHKLNMGLNLEVNAVNVFNAGTVDDLDNVPLYCRWTIQWDEDGYVFKNNGLGSLTMQIKSASTSAGAYVVASPYSDNQNCKWNLTLISSPPSGVYLYDKSTKSAVSTATRYIAPQETRTLSVMSLEVISYNSTDITQTFTWTPINGAPLSVNDSGTITGKYAGTTTVTAEKNLYGTWHSVSFTVVTTEIANGTYFLKNRKTDKYADINDGSMNNGEIIEQHDFDGADTQRWTFTHLGNGYYSIKSANSTTAYYLGVESDSTENDAPIVLRTGNLTSGMKWKVSPTTNGAFKIIPQTGEANNRVLAVGSYLLNTDGINIEQRDYVDDDNYKDEWYIESDAFKTTLVGITNTGHDHTSCLEMVRDSLLYESYYTKLITGSMSSNECLTTLKNTTIFTIRSHGHLVVWSGTSTAASTGIVLNDEENEEMIALYSHQWGNMTSGSASITQADSFDGVDLVLFIACYTGRDGETGRNLPNIVTSQGAEVAVGFSGSIDCSDANKWTKDFYSYLLEGYTVQESVDYASANRSVSSGLRNTVICGNENYTISE